MPTPVDARDLERMRDRLLFDGPDAGRKLTHFWTLLVAAAVIAGAGIVGDSTATVIGAMIVAPLMTPILGTVLAVSVGDARNLARCALLVIAGAVAVVAIGAAMGLLVPYGITAETSSQVGGRIEPRLLDLVAALATGAVGAFAVAREDVADTLPGVAIAISLVPPLAVAGLTLEAGETGQALGALLLFLTNVGAILLSGLVVLALYGVPRAAATVPLRSRGLPRRGAVALIVAFVAVIAVPLSAATVETTRVRADGGRVADVVRSWAAPRDLEVTGVEHDRDGFRVSVAGPEAPADPATLRVALDAGGVTADVRLEFTAEQRIELGGS